MDFVSLQIVIFVLIIFALCKIILELEKLNKKFSFVIPKVLTELKTINNQISAIELKLPEPRWDDVYDLTLLENDDGFDPTSIESDDPLKTK